MEINSPADGSVVRLVSYNSKAIPGSAKLALWQAVTRLCNGGNIRQASTAFCLTSIIRLFNLFYIDGAELGLCKPRSQFYNHSIMLEARYIFSVVLFACILLRTEEEVFINQIPAFNQADLCVQNDLTFNQGFFEAQFSCDSLSPARCLCDINSGHSSTFVEFVSLTAKSCLQGDIAVATSIFSSYCSLNNAGLSPTPLSSTDGTSTAQCTTRDSAPHR